MTGGIRRRRKDKLGQKIGAILAEQAAPLVDTTPEVDLFFADDSKQDNPSRPAMGPLVAVGGIGLPIENVRPLSEALDAACASAGFPSGEEFKWSPGKDLWMRSGLVGAARAKFFLAVANQLEAAEAIASVVIVDRRARSATQAASPELDVTRLLVERVEWRAIDQGALAIIISDRPGGGQKQDDSFLGSCLETLQFGTQFMKPQRIIHNVLSTSSQHSRLLQAADVVTGVTLSFVGGESTYSPPIFSAISPLLARQGSRCGGIGLKIHPDTWYGNLYHWLLGETTLWKGNMGYVIPIGGLLYSSSPMKP